MSRDLFNEGGELNTKRVGSDQYQLSIKIPEDADGRTARECRTLGCSPGYFKVKGGTGITGDHQVAYCPYCRYQDEPANFYSSEQLRYAKDMVLREAHAGVSQMLRDSLGLGSAGSRKFGGGLISMEMSLTEGAKPIVRRPLEEEVRRDVVCPHCGLDQSVYGLATWCADCGNDIFLVHVDAEFSVVRAMLSDVERRRNVLGVRIAAKDIENCLEDTVSILEAAQRALVRRQLVVRGKSIEEIELFSKKVGNSFQSLKRSAEVFQSAFGLVLLDGWSEQEAELLGNTLDKRHPITHNLGVIDRKYLERARSNEDEGKEVLVTADEIIAAVTASMRMLESVHTKLFQTTISNSFKG